MALIARSTCLIFLVLIFCFSSESKAQIIGLGDLPGGDVFSAANGVSANGSVVVGVSSGINGLDDFGGRSGREAFRWTSSGGLEGLGDLPGGDFLSDAADVSADGSVIVGTGYSANGQEAFRWTSSNGMQGLGGPPGEDRFREAFGVSDDGAVVVGNRKFDFGNLDTEAFRLTSSGDRQGLGFLPDGTNSQAEGVSADGAVVVGSSAVFNSGVQATRWTSSDGMQGLGFLPGGDFLFSAATGASADGSVVVGLSNRTNGIAAFRWTVSGGMQDLGVLPGGDLPGGRLFSAAADVSADGLVVVGRSSGDGGSEAFVWENDTGMRPLFDVLVEQGEDLSSWTSLDIARAISADGRTIVGTGTNSSGNEEAFVATINGPVLLGDVNLDGVVDFFDITPFITLLSTGGFQVEADLDESGQVNFLDVAQLIIFLS